MVALYFLALVIYGVTTGFMLALTVWSRPSHKDWFVALCPVVNTTVLVWEITRTARIWKKLKGL